MPSSARPRSLVAPVGRLDNSKVSVGESVTRRYFGTDGIRGRVGEPMISPDFVLKLGWAAGHVLGNGHGKVLIGKDTRISGYMFESALESGLVAAGLDVRLLGPMPTPGVAYLTRTFRAVAGIVITASHNPYQDNGIKFFSADGDKLPDEVELAIEEQIDLPLRIRDPAKIGKVKRIDDAHGRYIEFCKSTIPFAMSLEGAQAGGGLRQRGHLQHSPLRLRGTRGLCGARRHRTRRAQHQPRRRFHQARDPVSDRGAGGRGLRDRLRRRRRPGPDGGRQGAPGGRRRADLRHRQVPPGCGDPARRGGRHRHEQPGAGACPATAGGRFRPHQGRRPLHHGAPQAGARRPRRRALRAHHLPRPHQHRGRHRRRPAGPGGHRRLRYPPGGPVRGGREVPPGAAQCAPRRSAAT